MNVTCRVLLCLALVLLSTPFVPHTGWISECQAQQDGLPRERNFVLQRFRPSFDPNGTYNAYSAETMKQWNFFVGFWANYGHRPLTIVGKGAPQDLIDFQLAGDLGGGISLLDRKWVGLEVYASLPILMYQTGRLFNSINCGLPNEPGCSETETFPNAALGDLSFALKYRALDQRWQFINLALVAEIFFPTGTGSALYGTGGMSAAFKLVVSRRLFEIWNIVANIGVRLRPARNFLGVNVRNDFTYSIGSSIEVWREKLDIVLEVAGGVGLTELNSNNAPLELLAGLRFYPLAHKRLAIDLGGAGGLLPGYGIPAFRIFLGITYAHRDKGPVDSDGDGVFDPDDKCINTVGSAQNYGCPLDTDKDGIIDAYDRCPRTPGPRSNRGCPYADRDKDKVFDHEDSCPDQYGAPENNGCPWTDTDGDGLKDNVDQCPKVAGLKVNQGCPNTDRDKDTVVDHKDKCPDIPGPPSNKGCPKKVLIKVDKASGRILLLEKVYFKTASATILRRSYPILKQVVSVMNSNPKIRIRVEGHTDDRGRARYNLGLSKRRARSVRRYLIRKGGIDSSRLTSEGHGEGKPIATNKTSKGRAKNRRVEFHIVK